MGEKNRTTTNKIIKLDFYNFSNLIPAFCEMLAIFRKRIWEISGLHCNNRHSHAPLLNSYLSVVYTAIQAKNKDTSQRESQTRNAKKEIKGLSIYFYSDTLGYFPQRIKKNI